MKIGVIVDGDAEYRSLPRLLARTDAAAVVLHPLKADIQPLAPIGQIVASVKSRLKILLARNVDLVVILLDRETREECPGAFAKSIQEKLKEMCAEPDVAVVVKNRTFENWLVADIDSLEELRGRYKVTTGHRAQIAPNRADYLDATAMIKSMTKGKDYDKVRDAVQILGIAVPERIAENSRSFRRFLRIVGHPKYLNQSRRPA
jgi:hypothetical protein